MSTRFRGFIAALITPFHADRSLNLAAIPDYARLLRDNGVRAAFVCGTTGEGLSLPLEERFRVAEAWMQATDARLPGKVAAASCRRFVRTDLRQDAAATYRGEATVEHHRGNRARY